MQGFLNDNHYQIKMFPLWYLTFKTINRWIKYMTCLLIIYPRAGGWGWILILVIGVNLYKRSCCSHGVKEIQSSSFNRAVPYCHFSLISDQRYILPIHYYFHTIELLEGMPPPHNNELNHNTVNVNVEEVKCFIWICDKLY